MINTANNREIALDILMEISEKEQYLHVILGDALRKYQYLEKNERAFISRLVRGTVERQLTLDYVIDQVSSVKVKKMKPLIRSLMRMSVYQMMYMEQVPVSAVCNEAVKLAKKRHFGNLAGFVNGVLRGISRQLSGMELPDSDSIRYSMPEIILDILRQHYGQQALGAMLEAFLKERTISVITNTGKCQPAELKKRLELENVCVTAAPYIEGAFIISGFNYLDDLEAFREGLFQVQDISSMVAGIVAAPRAGDRIIDVCAAPGGKSIFAALSLKGTGSVDARDISEKKAAQIQENIDRLGLSNITASVMDATVPDEASEGRGDLVLADVPCSGLGIIGRKPDIKYNVTSGRLREIVSLQRRILDRACGYVKPGGSMIYSTCTLNPKENEENVRYIIEKGFEPEDITALVPEGIFKDSRSFGREQYERTVKEAKQGYLTLIPGIHECDGFFVARLRKKD